MQFPKIASLKTFQQFQGRLRELDLDLPADETVQQDGAAPLAQPIELDDRMIGNRFAILPMEGWDGTLDGAPSELTFRRWRRFGESGAKLIWGGEAVAVRHDGRANPNQLMISEQTLPEIGKLREVLASEHRDKFGSADDLLIGLQLTHSGRFARPNPDRQLQASLVYQHPLLDSMFELDDNNSRLLDDDDIRHLIDDFVAAAQLSEKAGFEFVDIKHCHGYFGHELLSAYDRPGDFGGDFSNRTRFLREVVAGIRANTDLKIAVRISVFDFCPFTGDSTQAGQPMVHGQYALAFGGDDSGRDVDLSEPIKFMSLLQQLGIRLVCTTAGSPYYCPHIQRPAQYPPSDGYLPPEDPLVGVARQIQATAELKREFPDLVFVGSGYSYLQEWLPNVAQSIVGDGWVDSVGLGRMVLSYPDLPADVLAGRDLQRKKICRTFSDCTTAPRHGMISGCFPLDPHYQSLPERNRLVQIKKSKPEA